MSDKYKFYAMGSDMWTDMTMWFSVMNLLYKNNLIKEYQYKLLKTFRVREYVDGTAYHDLRFRKGIAEEWITSGQTSDAGDTRGGELQSYLQNLWEFVTPDAKDPSQIRERTAIVLAVREEAPSILASSQEVIRKLERISILRLSSEFQDIFGLHSYSVLHYPPLGKRP